MASTWGFSFSGGYDDANASSRGWGAWPIGRCRDDGPGGPYGGRGGQATASFALPVAGDSVSTTITGLQPGRYAIRVFHDVDGDGTMSANPFGIPTEPFAFSNNARGAFGPAAWSDAAFEVAGDAATVILID